jgi:hypothetical protein
LVQENPGITFQPLLAGVINGGFDPLPALGREIAVSFGKIDIGLLGGIILRHNERFTLFRIGFNASGQVQGQKVLK